MKMKLYITTVTIALVALWLTACALPPTGGKNPLDRPYDCMSVAELHEQNIQAITSNPGYRLP